MSAVLSIGKVRRAWRSIAPTNTRRVLLVCGVFALLPLIAIYYSREPNVAANMKGFAGAGGLPGQGEGKPGVSVEIEGNDPVARFAETQVGHILYAPYAGDFCRRVLFHNRTGALIEGLPTLCVTRVEESKLATGADRLMALRKSFQK